VWVGDFFGNKGKKKGKEDAAEGREKTKKRDARRKGEEKRPVEITGYSAEKPGRWNGCRGLNQSRTKSVLGRWLGEDWGVSGHAQWETEELSCGNFGGRGLGSVKRRGEFKKTATSAEKKAYRRM